MPQFNLIERIPFESLFLLKNGLFSKCTPPLLFLTKNVIVYGKLDHIIILFKKTIQIPYASSIPLFMFQQGERILLLTAVAVKPYTLFLTKAPPTMLYSYGGSGTNTQMYVWFCDLAPNEFHHTQLQRADQPSYHHDPRSPTNPNCHHDPQLKQRSHDESLIQIRRTRQTQTVLLCVTVRDAAYFSARTAASTSQVHDFNATIFLHLAEN